MRLKSIIILLLVSSLFGSNNNINIFTETYPNYDSPIYGKLKGIPADTLSAILKQMKSKQNLKDVKILNWSRGYSLTQKVKNTMIFPTARIKEREKLFKWVGPINQAVVAIIAPKIKKIKIKKISDLNKYKIGAVLKDVGELLLISNGVNRKNIQYIKGKNAVGMSFKKMQKNRIDMFSYAVKDAFLHAKAQGFDTDKFEVVYVLEKTDTYFAFNKNTNDNIINKWQKALDEIKANGLYAKIVKRY